MGPFSIAVHTVHGTRAAELEGTLDEARRIAERALRETPDALVAAIRDGRGVLRARWERGIGWVKVREEVEA